MDERDLREAVAEFATSFGAAPQGVVSNALAPRAGTRPWRTVLAAGATLLLMAAIAVGGILLRAGRLTPAHVGQVPSIVISPGACTVSPARPGNDLATDFGSGPAFGRGPIYALVGEPLTYPEGGTGLEFAKVLWIGDPSAVGHAVITGHQVNGTHAVGFGTGAPQPELMWDLPNTRAWKSEPSEVQIAATGCYSFEVAIGKTHESIVLEVTATPPPSPTASSPWVQRLLMTDSFVGPITLSPTAVYALSNSLSLSGPEVGFMTLTRLERSTLIETRVDLRGNSGSERGSELLYAGGHLWLTGINVGSDGNPGSERWLDELDPQSLALVRRLALPSGTSGTLQFATAGDAATIWVGDENRLFWIDAASGSIRTTQQLPGAVGSLSVDPLGQRLYVGLHLSQPLAGDKNEVLELGSVSGTRLASLAVGVWELGSPGVAASNDGVWIWYATGNMATAGFYSAAGLQFKEGTASGHSNGVRVVFSGGTVWLSDSGILVACISPSSGQPIASTTANFTSIASDSSGAYAGGQGLAVLVPPRSCATGG